LPFKPGLVGGHCIGVDPYYLTHKAEEMGYHPQVILAGRRINDNMAKYAAQNLIKMMLRNGIDVSQSTVGIMGVTFKDNCPDIRNSKVIDLIQELISWGIKIVVTDPWANAADVKNEYGIDLGVISNSHQVDSLVVAVAHRQFVEKKPTELRDLCRSEKPVLADIKSIFNRCDVIAAGFSVFRF
jgi:UDP-N-acetyl-D-galactosamine dehydrogenase